MGTTKDGTKVEAAVMAYISPDVKDFFLSKEAMIQLGIINRDFPQVAVPPGIRDTTCCQVVVDETETPDAIPDATQSTRAECGCLQNPFLSHVYPRIAAK